MFTQIERAQRAEREREMDAIVAQVQAAAALRGRLTLIPTDYNPYEEKLRARPPKAQPTAAPSPAVRSGLREYDASLEGYRYFTLRDASGAIRMRVEITSEDVDERLLLNLKRWIDRKNRDAIARVV
jgi:hypothetical protein